MEPVERSMALFRQLDEQWEAGQLDMNTALAQIDAQGAQLLQDFQRARAAAALPGAKSASMRRRLGTRGNLPG